jgi:hypothetical protein
MLFMPADGIRRLPIHRLCSWSKANHHIGGNPMTYEKITGAINLDELEVQAEEVAEVSAAAETWSLAFCRIFVFN